MRCSTLCHFREGLDLTWEWIGDSQSSSGSSILSSAEEEEEEEEEGEKEEGADIGQGVR